MPTCKAFCARAALESCIIRDIRRVQNKSTRLRFLYQTRTITQSRQPSKDSSDGESSSQWHPNASLSSTPATINSKPTSTLTDTERDAFSKLFKLAVAGDNRSPSSNIVPPKRTQQQNVEPVTTQPTRNIDASRFPEGLRQIAAAAQARIKQSDLQSTALRLVLAREQQDSGAQMDKLAEDPLQPERDRQAQRIEAALKAAKTDIELWNVLENEIFSAIEALHLDDEQSKLSGGESPPEMEQVQDEERKRAELFAIIGPIYPSAVLSALDQLRNDFPGSSIPLLLLPRIKALGRSSYALGASTALYNQILIILTELNDFRGIDELLNEMDNGGIDFDWETLAALKEITRRRNRALKGRLQGILGQVWAMEGHRRDMARMEHWQEVIKQRFREIDERMALLQAAQMEQLTEGSMENSG